MKVLISLSTNIFSFVLQLTNCAKFTMMQYINLSEMRKKRYCDYLEQELTSGVKICFLASKFSEILWGKVALSLQFHMWKQRGLGFFCCSLFLQQSSKKCNIRILKLHACCANMVRKYDTLTFTIFSHLIFRVARFLCCQQNHYIRRKKHSKYQKYKRFLHHFLTSSQ